jgi:hypothetical protein
VLELVVNWLLPLLPLLLLGVLMAGKSGWFRSSNTSYPFRTWRLKLSASPIDVTNFTSGGFSEFMAGFITGECTASGFLDSGLQLTVGNTYTVSLGAGGGYSVTFTGVLLDLTASTDVSKAAEVEVMMRTNGEFTPTFALAG